MSKWIKCNEQMPSENEKVLIRINKEGVKIGFRLPFEPTSEPIEIENGKPFHWKDMEVARFMNDAWHGTRCVTHKDAVTHWQLLPEPPSE